MRVPATQATKDEAVRLYLTTDLTRDQVAEKCGVTERTFAVWLADFRDRNSREYADLKSRRDKLLRKQLVSMRTSLASPV